MPVKENSFIFPWHIYKFKMYIMISVLCKRNGPKLNRLKNHVYFVISLRDERATVNPPKTNAAIIRR